MGNLIEDMDEPTACQILFGYHGRFTEKSGMIFWRERGKVETPDETEAINYLCSEWDYGFDETMFLFND